MIVVVPGFCVWMHGVNILCVNVKMIIERITFILKPSEEISEILKFVRGSVILVNSSVFQGIGEHNSTFPELFMLHVPHSQLRVVTLRGTLVMMVELYMHWQAMLLSPVVLLLLTELDIMLVPYLQD